MKYTVELGSGAKIYIRSSIKTCSGFLKLTGHTHTHTHTHTHHDDVESLLLFLQIKESNLNRDIYV
jgi:hypothetical protein